MSANIRYEIIAMAFQRMTGMMAPGKDEPAACGGHDMDERWLAWEEWRTNNHKIIKAMLNAMEEVLGE